MKELYYRFRIWLADLFGAPVDARWFGAVGDGRKDDAAALNRAFKHVNARR